MQAKPQEVSVDKATTPAVEVLRSANGKTRFVEFSMKEAQHA